LEVLAAWKLEPFVGILMDVEMPELDGLATTAEIRKAERGSGQHVPIIAMTAHAMSGMREQCEQAGMDAFLSKPFKAAELLGLLERFAPDRPAPHAVDWDAALQGVDGSRELLTELSEQLLQDAPPLLTRIDEAFQAGTLSELAVGVHRLGGMVSLFAGPDGTRLTRRLEESARGGNQSQVDVAWPEVYQLVQDILAELQPSA
jgi:CheY-like chemotaxis protein